LLAAVAFGGGAIARSRRVRHLDVTIALNLWRSLSHQKPLDLAST